jgi:hypothetical protein
VSTAARFLYVRQVPPDAPMVRSALVLSLLLAGGMLAGCAPPSAPLYHDYRVGAVPADSVQVRLRAALREAGWEEAPSRSPGVLATSPRVVRDVGLSRIAVTLEATPVGAHHVRLFVHPVRRSVFGGRTKILALDRGLRRALWPPLDAALARQGFAPLPPLRQREAEAVRPPR